MSTWGYYSLGLVGYEVKVNEDNESVTWIYTGDNNQKTHHAKIYFTAWSRPYFIANGRRIYLDECIRTDIGREVN